MKFLYCRQNRYPANYLEKRFNLNSGYFKKAMRQFTRIDAHIQLDYGIVFVCLPEDVQRYIAEGYISVRMEDGDDPEEYDYVYNMTRQTSIGFYK